MNNYSASINVQSTYSQNSLALYGASIPNKAKASDNESSALDIQDILEIGKNNSKAEGKIPGYETILAILEEKTTTKIDASFKSENVDNPLSDDYWSPENTGGRIVNFALKYYDKYMEKSGGESEENLDKFLSIVKGAIDQGIGEAEGIISESSGGTIADGTKSTIQKTRDHIYKLLDEFRSEALQRINDAKTKDVVDEVAEEQIGAETPVA